MTPALLREVMRFFRGVDAADVLRLLTHEEKRMVTAQLGRRRRNPTPIGRHVTPTSVTVLTT